MNMKTDACVNLEVRKKTVKAFLGGEIDHHSAARLRQEIDEAVMNREPEELVLDFGKVSFMDSSGIGLVMGRYKLIEDTGCRLYCINLSEHIYKVMRLAGLEKIAKLQKKGRESDESIK